MPSRSATLRARSVAAVDRVFAEPILVKFMTDGRGDPDRPPVEVEGVLRTGAGRQAGATTGGAESWRMRVGPQRAELYIDRARFSDLSVGNGDRVQASSRPNSPWWEVLTTDDRGDDRLVLHLGEV